MAESSWLLGTNPAENRYENIVLVVTVWIIEVAENELPGVSIPRQSFPEMREMNKKKLSKTRTRSRSQEIPSMMWTAAREWGFLLMTLELREPQRTVREIVRSPKQLPKEPLACIVVRMVVLVERPKKDEL